MIGRDWINIAFIVGRDAANLEIHMKSQALCSPSSMTGVVMAEPVLSDRHRANERRELQRQWDEEYEQLQSIPSSRRQDASHGLLKLANEDEVNGSHVLDLGCGNGRNACFLAGVGLRVTGIDFSGVALGMLKAASQSSSDRIAAVQSDIRDGLPFDDGTFDIVLDSYTLCHFTDLEENAGAIEECRRVLQPHGLLLKIHIDQRDEYYLERTVQRTVFGHISFDPVNGFSKLHCSVESYCRYFADGFRLRSSYHIGFSDLVRNKKYDRSVIALVMEREK